MMTEYVTGQIYGWNGGECPVHPETIIVTWHRGGHSGGITQRTKAGKYWWYHRESIGDIIAFKVIKPYVELKTIWVNEYRDGSMYVHHSKKDAEKAGSITNTRVAVEYVEKKK